MFSRRREEASATCTSAGRVTAKSLLVSFLVAATPIFAANNHQRQDAQLVLPIDAHNPITPPLLAEPPEPAEHVFTLRHIYHHGTRRHPGLHRKVDIDIKNDNTNVFLAAEDGYGRERLGALRAKSNAMTIQRLVDRRPTVVDPMVAESRQRGFVSVLSPSAWTMDTTPGPNITDKDTVLSLAYMAADAYVEKEGEADWEDVGGPFNRSADFGWQGDGLRGHIFADSTNSTIVIGLKGTSLAVFDGDGTTTNDKENDNLFFSCCCAQQGPWTWRQVCSCATSTYTCNNTCVAQALREENRYYQAARELYANVSELYPHANIWLTGHSLGGAVSSFLGLTYGVPTVTFQAVPDALPAGRLGLPVPPGADPSAPQARQYTGAFHFGHTADPIYIGTCNGATASCSYGGYALESACHTGMECVYDTVGDKGWRVGIGTHKIRSVIHDVILKYETVPECKYTPECRDCGNWKMYESNGTETTTTSSFTTKTTEMSRTRTETCKTPGWWGCLDETTTGTGPSKTMTTTTVTTTTCLTPGWFGCKDKTTVSTTITSTLAPTPTPTTSCLTPGRFWGCYDEGKTSTGTESYTTTLEQSTITSPPVLPPTSAAAPSSTSTEEPAGSGQCKERAWYGACREWEDGEKVRGGREDI
ncbi:hypothetical protein QBC43DRAFT_322900 [Cladorrhinum sp. PSN259]|nr:hypothetical protein QBC43DRAFT_322900 [Cladorrhinum sp. PSN259]